MSKENTQKKWNHSIIAWLAVALCLHGLLLLIPLHKAQPPGEPEPLLLVQLQQPPAPQAVPAPPQIQPEPTKPVTPPVLAELPPPVTEPAGQEKEAEEEKTPWSAARLNQTVRNLQLDEPGTAPGRQLGIHQQQELPPNWRAGMGAESVQVEANRFSEMYAPAEVEIVDRWLAADGSHNVVVNLPNGDTVCGRANAWNPMQPLVEHVMLFRKCSGGGKRTFSMEIPESMRDEILK